MAYLLIVDDDPDFAESVATVCEASGHEVQMVNTPDDAFTAVQERRPDGILLDVMFPEDPGAGFKIARKLRQKYGSIPTLMLTAVNQKFPLGFSNQDIDSDWLPVMDFVEKPVDFDLLKEKISNLLAHDSTSG